MVSDIEAIRNLSAFGTRLIPLLRQWGASWYADEPKTLVSGTPKVPVNRGEESTTYRSRHERVFGTVLEPPLQSYSPGNRGVDAV